MKLAKNKHISILLATLILGGVLSLRCARVGYSSDQPLDAAPPGEQHLTPDSSHADAAVDSFGKLVTGQGSLVLQHDLAPYRDGFAVAWAGYLLDRQIEALHLTILSSSGEVLVPSQTIHPLPDRLRDLWVLPDPDGISIFYHTHDSFKLHLTRLHLNEQDPGEVAPHQATLGSYSYPYPFRTAAGYGVVFAKNVTCSTISGYHNTIHIRPFDEDGVATADAQPIHCSSTWQNYSTAVETNQGIIVAWAEGPHVVIATLNQDLGIIRGPAGLPDSWDNAHPSLAALKDGSLMVAWRSEEQVVLMALNPDTTPRWSAPRRINQPNLEESLNFALAVDQDHAVVMWESDWETALTQIKVEFFPLAGETANSHPTILTDPRYPFHQPQIARGSKGLGAIVRGAVEGTHGTFFVELVTP